MTTARITHKHYVPYGYFDIEFGSMEFCGDNADKYQKEWNEVCLKLHQENQREIKIKREMKGTLEHQNVELQKSIEREKKNRPFWHFWSTKQEKEYKEQIEHNKDTIIELCGEIIDLKNDDAYNSSAMLLKAWEFLRSCNFNFKNNLYNDTDNVAYIEIWELNA